MTLRKIFFLSLCVSAAFLYVYAVEIPREGEEKRAGFFLKGAELESLERISVNYREGTEDRTSFSLLQTDAKKESEGAISFTPWRLESLPDYPLDSSPVTILISALSALELEEPIKDDEDLRIFGLDKPVAVIEVVTAESGEAPFHIELGKKADYFTPVQRYVRVGKDGKLFLTDNQLFNAIDKTRDSFRDHSPLTLEEEDSQYFEVAVSGKEPLRFSSSGEDSWNLIAPATVRADDGQIGEFIRELQSLRADEFIDGVEKLSADTLDKYGLNTPDVQVRFFEAANSEKVINSISISTPETDDELMTYVLSSQYDSILALKGNKVGTFIKDQITFLDRKLFSFDSFTLSSLEVITGGITSSLTRKDDSWSVKRTSKDGKAETADADTQFVEEFLRVITSTDVSGIAADKVVAFTPLLTLKTKDKEGALQTYLVGPSQQFPAKTADINPVVENTSKESSGHLVVREGWDTTYWIDEAQYSSLIPKYDALKAPVKEDAETSGDSIASAKESGNSKTN